MYHMAAATSSDHKFQTQPIQPKRRRSHQNTITLTSPFSSSAAIHNNHRHRKLVPVPVVSPDNSWCCPASKPLPPTSPPLEPQSTSIQESISPTPASSVSNPKFRYSLSSLPQIMDSIPTTPLYVAPANSAVSGGASTPDYFPSSLIKFNSALTAGLLNPMSPPPSSADKVTRSSPTLFEMITSDSDYHPKAQIPSANVVVSAPQDKQALMQQRIWDLLSCRSPGNQFNDPSYSDVKLTLSSKDDLSVAMNVNRQILVAHSRFFATKLLDQWMKEQKNLSHYIVEIADCADIEDYIETIRLMYCKDLRKKLMKKDVSKVLGILKVSVAIGFDDGVLSCLEYLEAAPWDEDEEEKVASLLSELRLEAVGAAEVLKRVSGDVTAGVDGNEGEGVLLKLLHVILEGKDEKARRQMKGLVSKMLHENLSQNDLRKESLYSACDGCLQLLRHHFLRVAAAELQDVGQIARQADNLHWILDILIDRQIAGDFLKTWAAQSDLADAHSKVPAIHRYEISRVTARLFVGIGKRQLLASKDARCLLLQTWLVPFYDDFGWMRRASKGLDRHLIEDGLSNTILTLPLASQQDILVPWFDRFLNSGEDCPNIQRGFEVWWRRAFWRPNGEPERPWQMQITAETS